MSSKFVAGEKPAISFSACYRHSGSVAISARLRNRSDWQAVDVASGVRPASWPVRMDPVSGPGTQSNEVCVASTDLSIIARDAAEVAQRCRGIVRARAVASATVALVPIPGFELVADVALLVRMIERINREFGLTPKQVGQLDSRTRILLDRSITDLGAPMIGKAITGALVMRALQAAGVRLASRSVSRYVPLAGQVFSAGLSFAAVRYVGERHVRDCLRVLDCVAADWVQP